MVRHRPECTPYQVMASCRHVVKDLAQPSSAQPGSARRRFLHPLAIDRSIPPFPPHRDEIPDRSDQGAPHTRDLLDGGGGDGNPLLDHLSTRAVPRRHRELALVAPAGQHLPPLLRHPAVPGNPPLPSLSLSLNPLAGIV